MPTTIKLGSYFLAVVVLFGSAETSCVSTTGGFQQLTERDLKGGGRLSPAYSFGVFPSDYNLSKKLSSGPYLLEFFFSGCQACKENRSQFHEVAGKVASEAAVFEISIDCDMEKTKAWADETKPSWPVLDTCSEELISELEVGRFPTTLVLDRERQVILRHVGVWSDDAKEKILTALKRETR